MTESEQVNSAIEAVEKAYGKKVDIGIACAGITLWKDAHENTDGEYPIRHAPKEAIGVDVQTTLRKSSRSTLSELITLLERWSDHGSTSLLLSIPPRPPNWANRRT